MKKAGEFPIGRGLLSKWPWLLGVVSVTLALWGCEGSHLFAPIIVGPQITELSTAPEAIQSGESMTVSVRALGAVRVDSIVTTVRVGDFEQVGVARQVGVSSDFSAAVDFAIPVSVSDTLGTVEAYAVDGQRNVGPTVAVTVRAVDNSAPTVSVSLQDPRLGLGAASAVSVTAQDNVALSQIGFRIVDLNGATLDEFLVDEVGRTVQRVLTYPVPEDLPLGGVVLVGVAIDHAGNIGEGSPVPAILSDVDLAEIEILAPSAGAQEPAPNPLFVSVRVQDNDAVASVRIDGVAHRGDPTLGTDVVVARFAPAVVNFATPVPDTIVQRTLLPTADRTAENVFIRVAATDREGNVSVDSVEVSLLADELAPVVQINSPLEGGGQAVGDSILVETLISKLPAPFRTGITTLRLEGIALRGDPELGTVQVVPRFLSRTVTLDPPVFDGLVVSRYLPATDDSTEETILIIATAIDEWGNEGADTVRVDLVPDSTPPGVTISLPTGGSARAAGDSVLVQAVGFEPPGAQNQRGVARIRVDGVAYRPAQVLKYQEAEMVFSPAVDPGLLNLWIHPTADVTLETVWIRVTAEDGAGNATTDSVLITLTPPPPAPPPPPKLSQRWSRTPQSSGFASLVARERSDSPSAIIGGQLGLPLRFTSRSKAHGTPEGKRSRDGPPDRPHPS